MNKCCTAALFYPFLSLTIADTLMLLANTLLLGSISSSPPNFIMRLCSFPVMDSPFSIGIQKSMGSSKLDRKYMIGFGVTHKKNPTLLSVRSPKFLGLCHLVHQFAQDYSRLFFLFLTAIKKGLLFLWASWMCFFSKARVSL